jgi:hypothetical protein
MSRGTLKRPRSDRPLETPVFPGNRRPLAYGFAAISFLVNFTLYIATLAPTVTCEDSGELVGAAFLMGVPHEPGYPLFTLLGKLFTLLPLGDVAFRVNLMSAFFTALAGVFVFASTVVLVENLFWGSPFWKKNTDRSVAVLKYSVGLCSCILFGTAFSSWEQAVITEVYGLNSFFTGLFLFLVLMLTRRREERDKRICFYSICLVMGLSLTNHTTSAMLIPLFGIYLILTERKIYGDVRLLLKSFGVFLLGLTPFLYLPVAARRGPIINWGDPGNVTNFIRVITRHQYGQTPRTMGGFLTQFYVFMSELLTQQWFPAVLAFAIAGLIVLFKKNRPFFWFALAFLLFSMPIMTFMTNFDVTTPAVASEHRALVSVFYIPAYLFLSLLMGAGLFYALTFVFPSSPGLLAGAILLPTLALAGSCARNFARVNLHGYFCAREYSDNIFRTLPEHSLLLVHWDPFSFPLMYYQYVERKRPDLLVLDQMLLKRTWYVEGLRRHYPAFAKQCGKEINAFLSEVAPFESKKAYNGESLQRRYIGMINAFIDATLKRDRGVYCTYTPEAAIMREYRLEPVFSAYKFVKGDRIDTTLSDTACRLSAFTDKRFPNDRMKKYFREYYGNLYGLRAMVYETRGSAGKARDCYRTARALFIDGSPQAAFIDSKLIRLSK